MSNALKGLAGAQPNMKEPYFLVGFYKVQIVEVKLFDSTKDNTTSFIIRAKIVTSQVTERPVGTICSQVIKISGNPSALGNIKSFVAACIGADKSNAKEMASIDDASVLASIEAGDFNGTVLSLDCTNTVTKAGTNYTIHNWAPSA
jgi:hypothetical protein